MRWSYRLGKVAGIDLYVHVTFLMLLAWVGLSRLFTGYGLDGAVLSVALVGLTFGVVVLHELGHALAARRFGIPTRDITLLPIGGVARLARMPEKPLQELVVALAGPAVNLVLAVAAGALLFVVPHELVLWFLGLNVILLVFNLLPGFPMDGGRVLRALLALRMPRLRATEIAVRVGRWVALALGVAGLFWNPMLILVAVFLWLTGGSELAAVRRQEQPPERVVYIPFGRGYIPVRLPPLQVRVIDVR